MKWIRIDRPFSLPAYVKDALEKLDDADFVAYIVGGSVRDFLLGREIKDHDIATSAKPDEIVKLFPNSIEVGKAFGVIKVPTGTQPPLLEIATFRQDLEYKDHRHPTGVRFAGPLEDASRRDFTVNALFYDPKSTRILDPFDGMADLKTKVIRAIGEPQERFKEDALRLLRAVRFTTSLGFTLDPKTAEAVKLRAKLITHVSAERIRDEMTLMLTGPRPSDAIRLLNELGILRHVLPEVESLRGLPQPGSETEGKIGGKGADVWSHMLRVFEFLVRHKPVRSPTLAWATLLHDIGKPAAGKRSGGKNFNGHELDGAKMAEAVCHRLKMSLADTQRIVAMIQDHLKFKGAFQMRESTLQRFIREPHFEELLALHRADATASDGNLAFHEFCSSKYEEFRLSPGVDAGKLVTGTDLIQLGLKPGPGFTEILRTIEDLALEGTLTSKEKALEYVVKHFVR